MEKSEHFMESAEDFENIQERVRKLERSIYNKTENLRKLDTEKKQLEHDIKLRVKRYQETEKRVQDEKSNVNDQTRDLVDACNGEI